VVVVVIGLRGWRESRELSRFRAAQREARLANENVRYGLKTMAMIVPGLGEAQLELSARAMDLLDTQSGLLMALWRTNRRATLRQARSRRLLAEQLHEIAELDRLYENFQQAVLTAVCEQAAQRVVMPPMGTSKYRASFTVLEHQLPGVLWPAMNQILARQVQLWVKDAGGDWVPARRTGFRWGRELVFSRKNLEQASELRLVVAGQVVSEFVVEHDRTPPGRGLFRRSTSQSAG
jgi:hypothetical protein